jgi:uncharacterized repeat protein (TIGR02543 family)
MKGLFLRRNFPERYTITFDGNGGSADATAVSTNFSHTLDTLPTATRSGYTFNGWFTAASGGTQITTDTVFEADTTVYAQWVAATVNITTSGSGNSTYCYATINGTNVYGSGSYTVPMGSVIACYLYGQSTKSTNSVVVNGVTVKSGTGIGSVEYNYAVTRNATIVFSASAKALTITITEG